MEHVGLSVLYMLRITVGIFYMMSHDTNYGYKKILGLRGDRQDRTGQKRSLEARADAFSRLKTNSITFIWLMLNSNVTVVAIAIFTK